MDTPPLINLQILSSSQTDITQSAIDFTIFAKRQGNIFIGTYTLNEVTDIFVNHRIFPGYPGVPSSSILNRATPLIKMKSYVPPYNEAVFVFTSSSLINYYAPNYYTTHFHSCSVVGTVPTLPDDGSPAEVYFDSIIPNDTILLRDFIDRPITSSGLLYLFYDSGSNL